MKTLKQIFNFVIYSNLFIAACAILMTRGVLHLFQINKSYDHFEWFVFFATLASYNFHWLLTDPLSERTNSRAAWLQQHKQVHAVLSILGGIMSVFFLFQLREYWKPILPGIVLTMMYTAPKLPIRVFRTFEKFIIGKTFVLTAVWTYVTTVLPLLIYGEDWTHSYTSFSLYRFTLIFAVCILFDIRDKEADKITGIKSVVTLLSGKKIRMIFSATIMANIVATMLLLNDTFSLTQIFILLIPSIITYFLYPVAIRSANAMVFYFILDGLLALAPVLFFIRDMMPR